MVANHTKHVTRKGPQFLGIIAAARALGVHRVTLYRVLKGQYPDKQKLRLSYEKWLAKYAETMAARAKTPEVVVPFSPTPKSGKA